LWEPCSPGWAATGLVTTVWKISMHTAVAAGVCVILALVFGPWLLLTLTLPIGVGWSRVRPHAHTLAQVIAGGVLGAGIAAAIFIPLR
jgi:membrane-associated phospholipid phosphatase